MPFSSAYSGFSKPKSRRPQVVSTKWVDLQPRDRTKPKGIVRCGKKGLFWSFVNEILETFYAKIELPRICEIQTDFCDGYHIAKAHTRRRSVIRTDNWFHALRTCFACQECHAWADQRERDDSESIIEKVITDRFKRMGITEARAKTLLLECAAKVQAKDAESSKPKYEEFLVEL